MRIPFDSLVLSAVAAELRSLENGKVQRVLQIDDTAFALAIYSGREEKWVFISADAQFARIHLLSRKPNQTVQADVFCRSLRQSLDGARVREIKQIGFDRIMHLVFEGKEGTHTLIAELMGKHSNLILIDEKDRIVGCAKSVGSTKSVRPVLVGRTYKPPPFPPRKPIFKAKSWSELQESEGLSPFLRKLIEADTGSQKGDDFEPVAHFLRTLAEKVVTAAFSPVEVVDAGSYPISVAKLGLPERNIPTISIGLERSFNASSGEYQLEHARSNLKGQLEKAKLAKEVAIHDLELAADTARRAGELQLKGELILAYAGQITEGESTLEAHDYDGNPISVALLTDRSAKENAQRYFDKAKKAKAGFSVVQDQLARMTEAHRGIVGVLGQLEQAGTVIEVERLREEAIKRRWLQVQRVIEISSDGKRKDPFEGHRIRTLLGPGGLTVLYGENATSNDFLTLRIAKPNDWWLHVRGSVSAHVVIQTHNQPDKVGKEALMFAAKVAVQNSPSKHAGYVPVDYTLKKYVRKPKGAPHGTALYTHEKTLHVES